MIKRNIRDRDGLDVKTNKQCTDSFDTRKKKKKNDIEVLSRIKFYILQKPCNSNLFYQLLIIYLLYIIQ